MPLAIDGETATAERDTGFLFYKMMSFLYVLIIGLIVLTVPVVWHCDKLVPED